MLDLPRMRRIRLSPKPPIQRFVGYTVLMPNYGFLPGVKVEVEGVERIPPGPVIYAMNHTDRFNYFPFQFWIWRNLDRYTATWVKGKYYETRFVGMFMELTNNIPTVSRGYLITRDFMNVMQRRPRDEEYSALRRWVNEAAQGETPALDPGVVPPEILDDARDMLGRRFSPRIETYPEAVNGLFREMMARFTALNGEALDKGLDLLVFPEGTRSVQLSKGHQGLGQIALLYRKTIVPVGCNGSDLVYPGGNPIARKGRIVYRVGEPIPYDEMADWHVEEDYEPFSPEAEARFGDRFQGLVDVVMDRINGLLDPRHQYSEDRESHGVRGIDRFV